MRLDLLTRDLEIITAVTSLVILMIMMIEG